MEITTSRPGLLIGKRGSNIEELSDWLKKKVKIIEAKDDLNNYLIPYPPEDDESPYDNYLGDLDDDDEDFINKLCK